MDFEDGNAIDDSAMEDNLNVPLDSTPNEPTQMDIDDSDSKTQTENLDSVESELAALLGDRSETTSCEPNVEKFYPDISDILENIETSNEGTSNIENVKLSSKEFSCEQTSSNSATNVEAQISDSSTSTKYLEIEDTSESQMETDVCNNENEENNTLSTVETLKDMPASTSSQNIHDTSDVDKENKIEESDVSQNAENDEKGKSDVSVTSKKCSDSAEQSATESTILPMETDNQEDTVSVNIEEEQQEIESRNIDESYKEDEPENSNENYDPLSDDLQKETPDVQTGDSSDAIQTRPDYVDIEATPENQNQIDLQISEDEDTVNEKKNKDVENECNKDDKTEETLLGDDLEKESSILGDDLDKNETNKESEVINADMEIGPSTLDEVEETNDRDVESAILGDDAEKDDVDKESTILGYDTEKEPAILGDDADKESAVLDDDSNKEPVILGDDIEKSFDNLQKEDILAGNAEGIQSDSVLPANTESDTNTKDSTIQINLASFASITSSDSEKEKDASLPSGSECAIEECKETKSKDTFVISRYSSSDEHSCCMCSKNLVPKYTAVKEEQNSYICDSECYVAFKEKNVGHYIENLIRLRSFANQSKKNAPITYILSKDLEMEFEFEGDEENLDTLRKCGSCKKSFNIDSYISWEAIDFCNEGCLLTYQKQMSLKCSKCKKEVPDTLLGKYCVRFGNIITQFCSTTCLLQYKRIYKFCEYCQEDLRCTSGEFQKYCSRSCMEVCDPNLKARDQCDVCHQIKPVERKVRLNGKMSNFCGEPCLVAFKFVNQINPIKCSACSTYFEPSSEDPIIYSGNEPQILCSKTCQKIYLIKNRKIVVCSDCTVKKYDFDMVKLCENHEPPIYSCSNICLKSHFEKIYKEQVEKCGEPNVKHLENCIQGIDLVVDGKNLKDMLLTNGKETKTPLQKFVITKPRPVVKKRNVATMCRPRVSNESVLVKPPGVSKHVQTGEVSENFYVPVPVPIFVPMAAHMYTEKIPFPVPMPIPLPVPIFIPTSRKSAKGIAKEMTKIKNRVPSDPLEAELLMMAEMAAGDKKDDSSSESEVEETPKAEETFQSTSMDANPSFGEDVLSMALKMASDFDGELESNEPTTSDSASRIENIMDAKRKSIRQGKPKRKSEVPASQTQSQGETDANMYLKFSFGINAWKQWVALKNLELQKTQRNPKLFKTELLQLTADDLNRSLCLFVKEVRKPNGTEYAPDTIYYLCLGIQQYLYVNGRIDNIFCDAFYEKFTNTFDEVCQKFANLYSDSQYIVTRVEEEHLWESKQLGAHSPLVLLNTLMFFNTKHFSLTTVSEHLQLSFSHIMKHWKRNPHQPGSRNVLLRFYPPQNAEGRKKKVYEQQENNENPLRCPVKLYEFYLSKCPESVKTRNDIFYLQPERSCVPDSPVWYSTMALGEEPLEKMLNRVKMIKEINVALLTT